MFNVKTSLNYISCERAKELFEIKEIPFKNLYINNDNFRKALKSIVPGIKDISINS